MTIEELIKVDREFYLDEYFRNEIDNAIPFIPEDSIIDLSSSIRSNTWKITEGMLFTYIGNFYGLLKNELKIPFIYWYPNLKINKLSSSFDYDGSPDIKIIRAEYLEDLYASIRR